jgi:hypothetical protein
MTIGDVLRQHEAELVRLPEALGVGIGEKDGKEVIVVFVSQDDASAAERLKARLPETLDGYELDVRPEIRVFPGGPASE